MKPGGKGCCPLSSPQLALMGILLGVTIASPAEWLPGQGLDRPGNKPEAPEKGVFLVSDPKLMTGPFSQSVVLLLSHESGGTLGLIVNRPTNIRLSRVIPDLGPDDRKSPTLFFGGPVRLDSLICLFRDKGRSEDAHHVMDDVYYSGSRRVLERLLVEKDPGLLRVYMGHSGWAPGQLEFELARGDWQLLRADAATVFERFTEGIWRRLSRRPLPNVVARGFERGFALQEAPR